jgi:hypothetical protein
MEVLPAVDPTAVRHMLPMMMVHPVETQVAARQGMAQVPVVAAVIITTAILVPVALAAVPVVARAVVPEVIPVMEAREMAAQEVAIPVMVPRTTVPVVASLAVAPHMPLIVASRPEASPE